MTIDLSAPITEWMPTTIYVGHRPGLPDVVMGRWPAETGRTGYKTWVCETPAELAEVQRRLALPCPRQGVALDLRAGPDGALAAPARGMEPRGEFVVALYPPPAEGWPWLVLVSTPVQVPGSERGVYTWETMPTEAAALDHMEKLGRMARGIPITILTPPERQ